MNSFVNSKSLGMNLKSLSTLTLAVLGTLYGPSQVLAASILGSADSFAVLAGSTVTSSGASIVSGSLGVSPGSSVTGFPPGMVIAGTIHIADAVAAQAQIDVTAAYNFLTSQPVTQNLTGQDLGERTLTPGVYRFDSSAGLTGNLLLDAQGNSDAFFVFQIGSTLTTASSSTVSLINGGSDNGVFWQVGSSATLGSSSAFQGNVLALTSISMDPFANIGCGRALARNGAVTMANTNGVHSTGGINCSSGLNGDGEEADHHHDADKDHDGKGKDHRHDAKKDHDGKGKGHHHDAEKDHDGKGKDHYFDLKDHGKDHHKGDVATVPVPAALWLFGSGLLGLIGIARRPRRAAQ